ncbi:MAG: hypothetical protein FWC55_10300 [Firmicutes bacterium]|nr:hypothetical protein [Bacillota bacterium]
MQAVSGYYNGEKYVTQEKLHIKPNQRVIITILDEFINPEEEHEKAKPLREFFGKLDDESYREIMEALVEGDKVDIADER